MKTAAFRLDADPPPQVTVLQTEFGCRLDAEAKADGSPSHRPGSHCLFSITTRLRTTGGSYSAEAQADGEHRSRAQKSHNRRNRLGGLSKTAQTEEEDHTSSPYSRGHLTVVTNPTFHHGTPPCAPVTSRKRIPDGPRASRRPSPLLTQYA